MLAQKKRDVKPVEEAILSQQADASRIHCWSETHGQLVFQRTGDLNLHIEKIGNLAPRSSATEEVLSARGELKPNLGGKQSRKHAIVGAGIDYGIAAKISSAIEERHA